MWWFWAWNVENSRCILPSSEAFIRSSCLFKNWPIKSWPYSDAIYYNCGNRTEQWEMDASMPICVGIGRSLWPASCTLWSPVHLPQCKSASEWCYQLQTPMALLEASRCVQGSQSWWSLLAVRSKLPTRILTDPSQNSWKANAVLSLLCHYFALSKRSSDSQVVYLIRKMELRASLTDTPFARQHLIQSLTLFWVPSACLETDGWVADSEEHKMFEIENEFELFLPSCWFTSSIMYSANAEIWRQSQIHRFCKSSWGWYKKIPDFYPTSMPGSHLDASKELCLCPATILGS